MSTEEAEAEDGESGSPGQRVTWQRVLREVRELGLPELAVQIQPEDKTLVNFETIFYAEPQEFERSIQLAGQDVDVHAVPSSFRWDFGDGSEVRTTDSAGGPYPSKDIVHEYADADVTVNPRVSVVYRAEFRVNGGEWQQIPETITVNGPREALRVVEGTPVLVG